MVLVTIILLTIIIFSIPSVQTYVAKKVTQNLNEKYGTDINIKRLGLNWKGEVDAREIFIADHHKDTLIYSKQLQTNILSFQNLLKGDMGMGTIALTSAKLNIITYKGEETDNMTVFAEKFNTGKPSTNPFSLLSNDVTLTDSTIKFTNLNLENPEVIHFTNVNLTANNFNIKGPDIKANIETLSMNTAWGLTVKNLKADFSYTMEKMEILNLHLETGKSNLKGDIVFDYAENGLSDFINDVHVTAKLENSQLSTDDLNVFYNEFGPDQMITINSEMNGTLNDFTLNKANLATDGTRISGDFAFKNIMNGGENFSIIAKNHTARTNYYDLRRFMPRVLGDVLPLELKELGNFNFSGNTTITKNDLTTDSFLQSAIGQAKMDLVLGNITNLDYANYQGNIIFTNFNIGRIAKTNSLGTITANLNVDGRGFSQNTLSTAIEGKVSSFYFEGYNYTNITVAGNARNPLFDGNLTIDDPNLKLKFKGLIDASKEVNEYDFEANVEYAELNKLNLWTRDSIAVFTGDVLVDMQGKTIDDVKGTISFNQTFYQNAREYYYFDDFKVISTFEGPVRTIEINSPDIINGTIKGEFLIRDIPNLFRNGIGNIYANYIPEEVTTNQYIDYNFVVYNKIVDLFVPQLKLGDNTRVKGSVSSDESKFKLDFRSPEILLFNNYFGKVNIQVDNDNPLYNTYISVDSVYTGVYNIIDLNVINKTLNDTMYVRSEFKGGKEKQDLFNLSLYHTINPEGKSVVGVKKSDITYKDNVWFINENNNDLNKVTFDDNFSEVRIDSLVLNHNNEIIEMAGVLRDSTYKDLKLRFRDVNIGNIVPKVDSLRLEGNVNGKLDFLQKNNAYFPNSTVTIDGVVINDVEFGDLSLQISGNENLTQYNINTTLTNNDVKSISAVGRIDVSTKNPQINLNVDLNEFNMQAFSPFGGQVLSDIRGLMSGSAKVTGNYKSPDILGRFSLQDGGLNVPYLKTDFDIEDEAQIIVTKHKFEIIRTGITDTKYKTEGILFGFATHNNFQEWALDLNIEAPQRLLVLDTPQEEDALYYGTAFISGNASIIGPVDELSIEVNATTEEGTTFKIPLSDTEAIGDDSFIHFLSPAEKKALISGETIVPTERKGLTLDFNLDINNKAEVEVVVDVVNNSVLKGKGAGIILLRINTLGKFQIFGDFQVYEGTYDFRYGGLIQKNFEVVRGGSINWENGDPTKARLDLSAVYKTEANPAVLLDNPSVNRKIPVSVYVDLKGELIQPDLKFRIEFPRVSSIVRSELEFKLQTEEQRQNQALFLVASGQFVGDNYQGANAFTGTLVDRVSGLVNDLFAGEDSKFRVGLDYSASGRSPDVQTADRVGITLSTQISERILVNGKVGIPVGGVNETAVAGDIEVQWLVNEDGSLRMNFFNRQADLQFIGENQIFEQGVGISYSVDFDTFAELMQKLFNKKLTLEKETDSPIIPDDNSFPLNLNKEATNENLP